MPTPATADAASPTPKRSKRTLWLVLAICAAPLVASYATFFLWPPAGQELNYGELLEPRQLPQAPLTTLGGEPITFDQLKGTWVLLSAGPPGCDATCQRNLVYMRQVRLAQGKETGRVQTVWLLTGDGAPDPALLVQHPNLRVLRGGQAIVGALPAQGEVSEHIFVVDHLGHLMMRFPPDPDPRRILKDLQRLLRHSKWK